MKAEQEAFRANQQAQERERYENTVREAREFALHFVSYMNENNVPRSEFYGVKNVDTDPSRPCLGGTVQLTGLVLSGWQAILPRVHMSHAWDEGTFTPGIFVDEDGETYECRETLIDNESHTIPYVIDRSADIRPSPTLLAYKPMQEQVIAELASRT